VIHDGYRRKTLDGWPPIPTTLALVPALALALIGPGCPAGDVPLLDPLPVDPSPVESVVTIRVPSESAGDEGLMVRIFPPLPGSVRHEEGAPVTLRIPGGIDPGVLPPEDWVLGVGHHGLVVVAFTFPGGRACGEEFSGGTYDFRGADSVLATQDVLRFAAGELADMDGRLLTDHVPEAWGDNLGIFGSSNGGNMALQALARGADELPDVRWLVSYETPLGDQFVTAELNGFPHYEPGTCSLVACPVEDYRLVLRFDPELTTVANSWSEDPDFYVGQFYLDLDHNGVADLPEESMSAAHTGTDADGEVRLHYSTELTYLMFSEGVSIFGETPAPPWLATPSESEQYWELRDGAAVLGDVHEAYPDLMVIHSNAVDDHGSSLVDYPHARAHVHGWMEAGHEFVRLNADAEYLSLVTGADPDGFPDNPVGGAVPWPETDLLMVPEVETEVSIQLTLFVAGAMELADRYATGDRTENLDAVLLP